MCVFTNLINYFKDSYKEYMNSLKVFIYITEFNHVNMKVL